MPYLELAEGKKNVRIPSYFRNGHTTKSHVRHLSDEEKMLYVRVPDPHGKLNPVYVREDFFDLHSDEDFKKLLSFVNNENDPRQLAAITARRMARLSNTGLGDAALLSDIFSDIVDVVKIGGNFVPGGSLVTGAIGALTGVTSTGNPTHQPVVTHQAPVPDTADKPGLNPFQTSRPVDYSGGSYTTAQHIWLNQHPGQSLPASMVLPGQVLPSSANISGTLPEGAKIASGLGSLSTKIFKGSLLGIPNVIAYPVIGYGLYKLIK